ncbi:MAG: outer membrane protein assembly factor BamD [Bacteroidota bacterium]|nr:outer membrane protein assembly factor BamD [Bacteroidota bacterium]MDX5429838.1 outer membrane protein assembly factor BamD [Bacteroidota bacterium]MDX5468617.1 outer membrane protein assembly factor BamD [Bacteroidota bacterium]
MRSKLSFISLLLIMALSFGACSSYNKLLKSNDLEKKYTAAIAYYQKKDYYKAGQLFDELLIAFKGDQRFEEIYYYYSYCKYGNGELIMASYHFKNFYESFPTSDKAEEALYMHVYCDYLETYPYYLDPTVTRMTMDNIQLFINIFPTSTHVPDCNKYMDDLRGRLREKSLESARLYMKMEDYQAAIIAFGNTIKDYPELDNKDQIEATVVKCQYMMAINSVDSKKAARLREVKTLHDDFVRTYGTNSKHYNSVNTYLKRSIELLNSLALQAGYAQLEKGNYREAALAFKGQINTPGIQNKGQVTYLMIDALYKAAKEEKNKELFQEVIKESDAFIQSFGESHRYHKKVIKLKSKAQKALK